MRSVRIKDDRAVEPLITALRDADPQVRQNSVEALGKIKDARSIEPLIGVLKDNDSDVRWNAIWALGEMGVAAIEPLISAF